MVTEDFTGAVDLPRMNMDRRRSPVPVLYTIPNFITAGSGRLMLNIIEGLDRRRFSPAVCVSRAGGELDREVERMGIPFIRAPFTVPPRPYRTLPVRVWQAAQVFRPYRFGLWHSFNWAGEYTEPLIARAAGTRRWVYTKKAMGWGSRAWLARSYLASRIVVDNTDMPRVMFDRPGLRGRVRLIPHSVNVEQFTVREGRKRVVRERLGIPDDTMVAACVAHLVPVKGHPTLLDALLAVPRLHLLIAGKPLDTGYAEALKRQVDSNGLADRVHFLGGVTDVPGLLAEVEVVVLPTCGRGEGCPVALLEAMAAGRACIATDIPGSRDIITSRTDGLLVPPEDSVALAAALTRLVAAPELRYRLGTAARQRIIDHYRVEREVADHERLYEEMLDGS
jgi:glycosyltransferase involved in cell wall biosynthesis